MLVWKLKFQCPYCKIKKIVTSGEESKPKTDKDDITFQNSSVAKLDQLSIADSAVWGIMSLGGGHCNMEELFSTMGVKPIDIKSFQNIELKIGKVKPILIVMFHFYVIIFVNQRFGKNFYMMQCLKPASRKTL